MFTAEKTAAELGSLLGSKFRYAESDDVTDGSVTITDTIHVQVGDDYLIVVEQNTPDTFLFGKESRSYRRIADEVRRKLPPTANMLRR